MDGLQADHVTEDGPWGVHFWGRDQSRARPPPKVTRQIFGLAQACPTMPKLKPLMRL